MSFGVDGVNVFQGVRNGLTHQIQDKFAPHLEGIHYMAHCTNLMMQTFFQILIVKCIKDLFQCLYSFFFHKPKRHIEFLKLVEFTKVNTSYICKVCVCETSKGKNSSQFGHRVWQSAREFTFDPPAWTWEDGSKFLRFTTNLGRKLQQRNNQRLSRSTKDKWRDMLQVQSKLTWQKIWHNERFRKEATFMWSM